MFYITTSFSPIRVVRGDKSPVVLEIKIRNDYPNSKLASVMVKAPFSLGFDSVGLFRETRRRIGYLKSGMEKTIPIQLFPKTNIGEGNYNIDIKVYSHRERYDKNEKEFNLNASLRVISK